MTSGPKWKREGQLRALSSCWRGRNGRQAGCTCWMSRQWMGWGWPRAGYRDNRTRCQVCVLRCRFCRCSVGNRCGLTKFSHCRNNRNFASVGLGWTIDLVATQRELLGLRFWQSKSLAHFIKGWQMLLRRSEKFSWRSLCCLFMRERNVSSECLDGIVKRAATACTVRGRGLPAAASKLALTSGGGLEGVMAVAQAPFFFAGSGKGEDTETLVREISFACTVSAPIPEGRCGDGTVAGPTHPGTGDPGAGAVEDVCVVWPCVRSVAELAEPVGSAGAWLPHLLAATDLTLPWCSKECGLPLQER